MPDAHANFAVAPGGVTVAPSPAASGTTLSISNSDAAAFPDPASGAYNVTIWPTGEQPLTSNAEIVRFTAKGAADSGGAGNTQFTIDREEEGTSARTIVTGDQVAMTITKKVLTDAEGADYAPGGTDVAVADGGTGAGTFTDGGVLIGNGTSAIQVTSAGSAGQVLTSGGTGVDPTYSYPWWQELGRTTLGSAGDTITSPTFTAKKYLQVLAAAQATGGTINLRLRFNGDTAGNYNTRASENGAADGTATGATNTATGPSTAATSGFMVYEIINIATEEKLVFYRGARPGTAGAANLPTRNEGLGKWANSTNAITSVTLFNDGTGDYAIGSEVVVLGHD